MYAELTRICTSCRVDKQLKFFNKDKTSKYGHAAVCKDCRKVKRKSEYANISKYNKEWRIKNLEYAKLRDKKHNLKRKFNLSMQEFEQLKANQQYGCAICSKNRSSSNKDLCVDHCHKSGKIRGLLCDNCNRGIGLLQDSEELLKKAVEYLQNSKK